MSLSVRPGPFAQDEIEQHIRRYESESPGLGRRFLLELQRVVDLIAEHPEAGSLVGRVRPRVRRFPLRRFPFFVIYREKGDVIEIVAVAPMKRRPSYWRSRLRLI